MTDEEDFQLNRSIPLPSRVRTGAFEDDELVLENARIPWGEVECLALGIIDLVVKEAEAPRGAMRKMMGKVMGKDEENKSSNRSGQVRETYIVDLFVEGEPRAFRLESGNVSYRQFLDEVGYVSLHNFYKFCVHLTRRCTEAKVNPGMAAFLKRKRESVEHFPALYDFELEVQAQRLEQEQPRLTPVSELDLSRDNWADEWDDW